MGSVRLPGKNLAKLEGRSLLARAIETAQASAGVHEVLVSSDGAEILDEARSLGAGAERRSDALATGSTTTSAVIDDVLSRRPDVTVLLVLQPTSPLRMPADVEACLVALQSHPAATTVTACDHPSRWTMTVDKDKLLVPRLGSWSAARLADDASEVRLNGAVYAARAEYLRRGEPLVGPATVAVLMPRGRSIDVDDAFDLHLARLLVEHPFISS